MCGSIYDTGQLKTDMSLVNIRNRKYTFWSEIAARHASERDGKKFECFGNFEGGLSQVFSGIDATEEFQQLFLDEENRTNSW